MRWRGLLWTLAVSMLASAADARAWTTLPHWRTVFEAHAYERLDRLESTLDRLHYEHERLLRLRRWPGSPAQAGAGAAAQASAGAAVQASGADTGADMAELGQLLQLLAERRRALRDALAVPVDPAYQLVLLVRLDEAVRVAAVAERNIAALRTGARQELMMTSKALLTGARARVHQAIADSGARILNIEVRDDLVIARIMTTAGDDLMYWGGQVPMTAGAIAVMLSMGLLWRKRQRAVHPLILRVRTEAAVSVALVGLGAAIAGAWISLARQGEHSVVLGASRCPAVIEAHALLAAGETAAAAAPGAPERAPAPGLGAHVLAGELALCEILAPDDASADRAERMLQELRERI